VTGPALSRETLRRIELMFQGEDRQIVEKLLVEECGNNLPCSGPADKTPEQAERVRFAALRFSEGNLQLFRQAIELAKNDWRDLLMAAGFGEDVTAHLRWNPETNQKN
jgi:hypothetical protein